MTETTRRFKGISRIDDESRKAYGWYVRACYDGTNYAKYFGDVSHGGKERAFRKAVRYRKELEKQFGKPRRDSAALISSHPVPTKAASGFKGIGRIDQEDPSAHGWYVRVFHDGKTHAKYFGDASHGVLRRRLPRRQEEGAQKGNQISG